MMSGNYRKRRNDYGGGGGGVGGERGGEGGGRLYNKRTKRPIYYSSADGREGISEKNEEEFAQNYQPLRDMDKEGSLSERVDPLFGYERVKEGSPR